METGILTQRFQISHMTKNHSYFAS
uniref:Uncharacterized protein n=1 Tax=Anguilla anguilla TaxID=7936 RepID=A0A0E9VGW4_ANGAN